MQHSETTGCGSSPDSAASAVCCGSHSALIKNGRAGRAASAATGSMRRRLATGSGFGARARCQLGRRCPSAGLGCVERSSLTSRWPQGSRTGWRVTLVSGSRREKKGARRADFAVWVRGFELETFALKNAQTRFGSLLFE